jgi:tetratricopeptide (TPR) repeat protein
MKNKFILSLWFLILSYSFCTAQNTKADSIKNEKLVIAQSNDFSDKQKEYLKDFVYEKSEKNIDRALDLVQVVVALVGITFTIFSLAFLIVGFMGLKEFRDIVKQKKMLNDEFIVLKEKSDEVYKLSENLTRLQNNFNDYKGYVDNIAKNRIMLDSVNLFRELKLYEKAIALTNEIEIRINDNHILFQNYKNRAMLHIDDDNPNPKFREAYKSLMNALKIKENDIELLDNLAYCLLIIANNENDIHKKSELINQAEYYFNSLDSLINLEDKLSLKRLKSNKGILFIEKNEYKRALNHFDESKSIDISYPTVDELNNLGIAYCLWKLSLDGDKEIGFNNFKIAIKKHSLYNNQSEKLFRYFHLTDLEIEHINAEQS